MMNHLVVILCYVSLLGILILCTKSGRTYILPLFLFLFIFKLLIALAIYQNNLAVISHIRPYSMYDAGGYYNETLELLKSNGLLFPDLPWYVADPGYNTLLYWIGMFYSKVLRCDHMDYLLFLYFNVFVVTVTFFLVTIYFKERRLSESKAIVNAAVIISAFEPTMLAFGSVLEREVLVGLIAFLTFVGLMGRHWVRSFGLMILLILFRRTYMVIAATILVAYVIYANLFSSFWRRHFVIYLMSLLGLFGVAVHVVSVMNQEAASAFFRHTMGESVAGFGGIIATAPYGIRVVGYSLLGFFSPIPLYPFFDGNIDGFYLFGLLAGLGSVFYLCCHLIIIGTILRLKRIACGECGSVNGISRGEAMSHFKTVTKGYVVVFILHLVFQGFIYNVRHKVQVLPILIYLALYCVQFLNLRSNTMVFFRLKHFSWSVCIIVFLNVVYLAAKVF